MPKAIKKFINSGVPSTTTLHYTERQNRNIPVPHVGLAFAGLFCLQSIISDFHQSPSLFCTLFGGSLLHCKSKEVLGLHRVGRLQLTVYLYVKCYILLISPHIFLRTRQAIMNLNEGTVQTLICTQMWGKQACLLKRQSQPYFMLRKERCLSNKVTHSQILTLHKITYNTSQASLRMDSKDYTSPCIFS